MFNSNLKIRFFYLEKHDISQNMTFLRETHPTLSYSVSIIFWFSPNYFEIKFVRHLYFVHYIFEV